MNNAEHGEETSMAEIPHDTDPTLFLAKALVMGSDAAIRDSESRGQQILVNSSVLPSKVQEGDRTLYGAIGIKFLDDSDELFVNVELPAGWEKRAADHAMWSTVVDERGRERISVFYKAAFYDRSAFMRLTRRFGIQVEYKTEGDYEGPRRSVVTDANSEQRPFASDWHVQPSAAAPRDEQDAYWKAEDEQRAACGAWLAEHFPDFESPVAYWDEA